MIFSRSWRKSRHKQLRRYAAFRVPANTDVLLITRLPWLLLIHGAVAAVAVRSDTAVPWWSLCILPLISTAVLIAVSIRERENGLAGFFRYNSAFYLLVSVSLLELTVAVSVHSATPYALIVSLIVGFLTVALLLNRLRKQIEENTFSEEKQQGAITAGLAGVFGLGSYFLLKQIFPEQVSSALSVMAIGILAAFTLGVCVVFWLKSVGADSQQDR